MGKKLDNIEDEVLRRLLSDGTPDQAASTGRTDPTVGLFVELVRSAMDAWAESETKEPGEHPKPKKKSPYGFW